MELLSMPAMRKLGVAVVIFILILLGGTGCASRNGISIQEDAQLSPSHPTQVQVDAKEDGISLTWLGTGDDRIKYYQVYRKTTDVDWQTVTQINSEGDNRGSYEYLDRDVQSGVTYIYGVSAINTYGKESPVSESPPISAP
jgi:hypothetical protein